MLDFPGDNDMTIDEGDSAVLELEAVPDRTVDIPFNVTLSSAYDVTDYHLNEDPAAISQNYELFVEATLLRRMRPDADGSGASTRDGTQPFTVRSRDDDNDGDRVDDTVTVTARTTNQPGTQRTLVTFDLKVIDLDKLPEITDR